MSSGSSKSGGKRAAGKSSAVDYKPYAYGQITKREAGAIYKAQKNGDISVLPETVSTLYDQTNDNIRYSQERYNRDSSSYDRIYKATGLIENGEYKKAQAEINKWQESMIKRAGRKSRFFKYTLAGKQQAKPANK